MGKKTLYLVCEMRSEMLVRVRGAEPDIRSELKLSWADGMIGCMPVFETMDEADEYLKDAASNADVLEVYETLKEHSNG